METPGTDPTAPPASDDVDLTGGAPADDDEFATVPPAEPDELGTPVPGDLPPDVQPGSLGGINPSEEAALAEGAREHAADDADVAEGNLGGINPSEEEAARLAAEDAARAGEEEPEEEPEPIPGADTPPPAAEEPPEPQEPQAEPEAPVEPQAPAPGAQQQQEPPADPPADPQANGTGKKQGGAASREYVILEELTLAEALRRCSVNPGDALPAEVGEQVVYVRRTFEVNGETRDSLTARNPENSLRAAGRFIGEGYSGRMVPVPEGSWKVRPVNTKPRSGFAVDVG